MAEMSEVFDLLMELEEAGVTTIVTDGRHLLLQPGSKLSLRLRQEVRRYKKELLQSNIQRLDVPPGVYVVAGDVEIV